MFVSVEGLYDSMSLNQMEAEADARTGELTVHVALVRPFSNSRSPENESARSGSVVNLGCEGSGAVWKGLPSRSSSESK
jgi:hypothetical protein